MTEIRVLEDLGQPDGLTLAGRGGWEYKIVPAEGGEGCDIVITNPADTEGGQKFYAVTTVGNRYGAPTIVQEPTLGVALASIDLDFSEEAAKEGFLVGAITLFADGAVNSRFSWSNLVYMQEGSFEISGSGKLAVNGEPHGYLHCLILPDKNRMTGYVGIFKPVPNNDVVKVFELEDLAVNAVMTDDS